MCVCADFTSLYLLTFQTEITTGDSPLPELDYFPCFTLLYNNSTKQHQNGNKTDSHNQKWLLPSLHLVTL